MRSSWITQSAPAESFVTRKLTRAEVLVLHGKMSPQSSILDGADLFIALSLVRSARRSSESFTVSLLARKAFFCRFAMPILLLRRTSSVSPLNVVNSELTSTMLAHMALPLILLLFPRCCQVVAPPKSVATSRRPDLVVLGSASIQAPGKHIPRVWMIQVLTAQPVLLALFRASRTLTERFL